MQNHTAHRHQDLLLGESCHLCKRILPYEKRSKYVSIPNEFLIFALKLFKQIAETYVKKHNKKFQKKCFFTRLLCDMCTNMSPIFRNIECTLFINTWLINQTSLLIINIYFFRGIMWISNYIMLQYGTYWPSRLSDINKIRSNNKNHFDENGLAYIMSVLPVCAAFEWLLREPVIFIVVC